MKINTQLFGEMFPPFYGVKDAVKIAEEILAIDEKINELMIEREELVKAFKKQVKDITNPKNKI